MSDGGWNDDDTAVTSADLHAAGDLGGMQTFPVRLIDPTSGAGLFTTNTDPNVVGIDPLTGASALVGTDVGFGAGLRRWTQSGIYNGDFALPPPNVSAPIGTDNPLPYWTLGGTDGGTIAVTVVSATSGSGRAVRFELDAGAGAGQEAWLEQVVPIAGGLDQAWNISATAYLYARSSGAGIGFCRAQYLKADGTATGSEVGGTRDLTTGMIGAQPGQAPTDAYWCRLRFGVTGDSAAGTLTYTEVRAIHGADRVVLGDRNAGTGPGILTKSSDVIYLGTRTDTAGDVDPAYGTMEVDQSHVWYRPAPTGTRLLSAQLVPLDFVLVNIPVGAATELQPSDDALALATPRLRMPWPGSIVGMSYRLSAAIGAGTLGLRATVGGTNVWTAHSLGVGDSNGQATQAIGTDTFATSDGIGVEANANGSLTANLDVHVILWVALDYDGA